MASAKEILSGTKFPSVVFSVPFKHYSFIPFSEIFEAHFIKALIEFLMSRDIKNFCFETQEPLINVFSFDFSVDKKIREILNTLKKELTIPEYIEDTPVSAYEIVDKAVIYSPSSDEYCIYLDRAYDIAIIAHNHDSGMLIFEPFKLNKENLIEYLKMSFLNQEITSDFVNEFNENWFLKISN
ncbi:MAG: hypothetical protein HYY40_05445 [Bacteroidetes bacterium]|nr:hypothetical protein [Bacteroidota bacterium]